MANVILVKEKVTEMPKGFVVPMHPKIVFIEKISQDIWKARDNNTGHVVTVSRNTKGKFCEYDVNQTVILV